MSTHDLPTLNAILNFTAFLFLLRGWRAIRQDDVKLHRRSMTVATLVSTAFLASYVTYHSLHGSTPFEGTGLIRTVYFAILWPHVVLAAIQVPLIITTIVLAIRNDLARHRKWARVTLPIWLFVSVTGVVIYLMLYHLVPAESGA